MKAGIYIHIPFCESRCIYCGFYSTTRLAMAERYTRAIVKEMDIRRNELHKVCMDGKCDIDSIYIGGGTPSVLPYKYICEILNEARRTFGYGQREITMEMNPDDVTLQLVEAVKNAGVNRVSMGVQTFSDSRLRFIRRRHNAMQAKKAVATLRDCGMDNISIDLMFGFPNETIEEWTKDIDEAISLRPNHISAYCLMYEEGTNLYKMLQKGEVRQIDEDLYVAMYSELVKRLITSGYEHYEISNFALPGYRSIHNSSYWHDIPYLGLGASAHSYLLNERSWNVANLMDYIKSVENGKLPSEHEDIDSNTHYNDLVTTELRTCDGLNLATLDKEHAEYALRSAKKFIDNGLLEIKCNRLKLTDKGIFISDLIMSDLIKI